MSPLVVQRRLKLANVSPRLVADYRTGGVTLEQLMALTITDDHAAQEAAFYGAPEWQRGASALRERLTEREMAATQPLVLFVGLDAYTAAGGVIRCDLFADDDSGKYLTDAALLEALVRGKLDTLAEGVRTEGWVWVEAVPHLSYAERQAFQDAPRQRREPTAREARRVASLQSVSTRSTPNWRKPTTPWTRRKSRRGNSDAGRWPVNYKPWRMPCRATPRTCARSLGQLSPSTAAARR